MTYVIMRRQVEGSVAPAAKAGIYFPPDLVALRDGKWDADEFVKDGDNLVPSGYELYYVAVNSQMALAEIEAILGIRRRRLVRNERSLDLV